VQDSELNLDIIVPEAEVYGSFANAFCIHAEGDGAECFLDFMVLNETKTTATVISRVRIRKQFLPQIRLNLDEVLGLAEVDLPAGAEGYSSDNLRACGILH